MKWTRQRIIAALKALRLIRIPPEVKQAIWRRIEKIIKFYDE
jgi:hypothetical protein